MSSGPVLNVHLYHKREMDPVQSGFEFLQPCVDRVSAAGSFSRSLPDY